MAADPLREAVEALLTKPAEVVGMPEPWKGKVERALCDVQDYLRAALRASPPPAETRATPDELTRDGGGNWTVPNAATPRGQTGQPGEEPGSGGTGGHATGASDRRVVGQPPGPAAPPQVSETTDARRRAIEECALVLDRRASRCRDLNNLGRAMAFEQAAAEIRALASPETAADPGRKP